MAGNFKIFLPQLCRFMPQRHPAQHHVIGNASAALSAGAADGKEIVDDACAKKAVAELTRE